MSQPMPSRDPSNSPDEAIHFDPNNPDYNALDASEESEHAKFITDSADEPEDRTRRSRPD